jgi:hypothetical protein
MSDLTDQLDAIQSRLDAAVPGAITITPSDIAFLLDLAREQQAAIDAVLEWCDTNQYPFHPSEGAEGFSSQDWALDDAARRVRTAITQALEAKP